MSRNIYLKHYRLGGENEVSPQPVATNGSASTFKATDARSGAPVLLTLIPVGAIRDEDREEFETKARAIVQFDHVHVGRTFDFGQEDDEYAFASEYPRGGTTKEWVSDHGPMPPEAVLRVAIQIVSVISAAVYRQIVHEAISPGNIVITPGQIAEGGWPSVKLANLTPAGAGATGAVSADSANFASPEQLTDSALDFRSEIYSLGATMCFLLKGTFDPTAGVSSQISRLPGPLRKLIQPMLRADPAERPQDLEAMTETLRATLQSVERRQSLARRVGMPFLAVRSRAGRRRELPPLPKQILAPIGDSVPPPVILSSEEAGPVPRARWSPAFAIVAALLLGLGIIGAAVIPARQLFFAHSGADKKGEIGVPVGVSQPAPVWEGKPLVMNKNKIPATSQSPSAGAAAPVLAESSNVAPTEPVAAATTPSASVAPAVAQGEPSEPPAPAKGPESVWEKAGNRPLNERVVTKDGVATGSRAETPNDTNRSEPTQEAAANTGDQVASNAIDRNQSSADAQQPSPSAQSAQARLRPGTSLSGRKVSKPMTGRGSVARIAPDGSVILRLPDGTMAVLPPPHDDYRVRRHYRRDAVQRRTVYPPDDGSSN